MVWLLRVVSKGVRGSFLLYITSITKSDLERRGIPDVGIRGIVRIDCRLMDSEWDCVGIRGKSSALFLVVASFRSHQRGCSFSPP